ncbi:MAG: AAA family ATPase, partial [Candidatus Gastranaerophilales bacterium]|nr:AAA family ATPase [Candidatus Gastranaerophilales bacterium]
MICPRCGKRNPEKAVTCQECGLKIGTICPRCRAYNKIGQAKCVNCNLTLIRFCPKCKAANFPNATHCRKCGTEILKKAPKKPTSPATSPEKTQPEGIEPAPQPAQIEKKEEIIEERREELVQPQPETTPESEPAATAHPLSEAQHEEVEKEIPQESTKKDFSRVEAGMFLEQVLTRSNRGFLIDISGADGIGKSTIISNLAKNITDRKFIWLVGNSEPNHSKFPYSFFRDMLRSLFNVPILIENKDELRKNIVKAVEVSLDISDKKIINTVCKLLLNEYEKNAADIEQNSAEINDMIEKIIMGLAAKSAIALVAEDFEYIDKASFDCIKHLLRKGFLDGTNFLFLNHSNAANFSKFFPEEIASNKYLMLVIKPSEKEELNAILMSMMNNQDVLPENVKQKMLIRSKGIPVFLEQALWFMFQVGALYTEPQGEEHAIRFNPKAVDIEIPGDLTELLNKRFDIIEKAIPAVDKVIFAAAAFGYKFPPFVVQQAVGIEDQQANEIFQLLINSGIFSVVDA